MDGWDSNDGVHVEDFPVAEAEIPPMRRFKWVSENYFETMATPAAFVRGKTDHVERHLQQGARGRRDGELRA